MLLGREVRHGKLQVMQSGLGPVHLVGRWSRRGGGGLGALHVMGLGEIMGPVSRKPWLLGRTGRCMAAGRTGSSGTARWSPRLAMEGMANGIAMKFMAGVSGMIIKIAVGAVEGRTSRGGTGRATNSHGNDRESCRKKN